MHSTCNVVGLGTRHCYYLFNHKRMKFLITLFCTCIKESPERADVYTINNNNILP